ncbi:Gpc5p [Chamberlinius hualienensis]
MDRTNRTVQCFWLPSAVFLTTICLVLASVVNRTESDVLSTLRSTSISEHAPAINAEPSCAEIRHFYTAKMLGSVELVPKEPISGSGLQICESQQSCCTPEMETQFKTIVKQDLLGIVQSTISHIKNLLTRNTEMLQEHFLDLTKIAENETILLFDESYKQMAIQTHDLISRMFQHFRDFLEGRKMAVDDAIATFFDDLFPHVYHRIINPKLKDFNNDYKDCLKRTRVETKPFGDVPTKIAILVMQTFLASRTFIDALHLGVEVVETLNQLEVASECEVALHRLLYCPKCQGFVGAKACNGYCSNVIRGCLASVAEMDQPWNDYLKALEKLSAGMEAGSVMNNVVSELPTKISEAIMYAMDNGPVISEKVKEVCGHPKRDGHDYGETLDSNVTMDVSTLKPRVSDSNLYVTVRNFMGSLDKSKSFFANLADLVCNEDSLAVRSESNCWNGHALGEYSKTIAGTGLSAQKYNPELKLQQFKDAKFAVLIERVKQMRKDLDSKSGLLPDKDSIFVNDGSGSGWNHRDEDHFDDEDYGDGSGSGDNEEETEGEPRSGHVNSDTDISFDNTETKPSIVTRPTSKGVSLVQPLTWLQLVTVVFGVLKGCRWTSG